MLKSSSPKPSYQVVTLDVPREPVNPSLDKPVPGPALDPSLLTRTHPGPALNPTLNPSWTRTWTRPDPPPGSAPRRWMFRTLSQHVITEIPACQSIPDSCATCQPNYTLAVIFPDKVARETGT